MGKNALKFRGFVLGNSSTLFYFVFFLFVFASAMAKHNLSDELEVFSFKNIQPRSKWNVSQEEFAKKHKQYFDLVEKSQKQRLKESQQDDRDLNFGVKTFYTFQHSGPPSLIKPHKKSLNYKVNIPKQPDKDIEVEQASLRLLLIPKNCGWTKEKVTIKVLNKAGNQLIKKENFALDECSHKWVGIDINDFVFPNQNFAIFLHCEECVAKKIELSDPFLNVVVSAKNKVRIQRAASRKKIWKGACARRELMVDPKDVEGLQHVVQPKRFDAGLCFGNCHPRDGYSRTTQHALIQFYLAKQNRTIPKPCCTPETWQDMHILFVDDKQKMKTGVWKHTVVSTCKCS